MQQSLDVKGKVIVITGGSGTLGGAMAAHLMQQGAKVAIIGYREESVMKKLKELSRFGTPIGLAVDVNALCQKIFGKQYAGGKMGAAAGKIPMGFLSFCEE